MRTSGLSRRAYARQRGCSEAAVRKAIADGRLKKAVLPDGSIDAHRADELLAHSTIASREPPSELSEARLRKLRVQCALLRDEIEGLERASVSPAEAAELHETIFVHAAGKFLDLVNEIAPNLVEVDAPKASAVIQEAIYAALDRLASTQLVNDAEPSLKSKGISLSKLTGTQLEAMKTTLQARRMELEAARRDGTSLSLEAVGQDLKGRIVTSRSKLLALPHRAAPLVQQSDEKQARIVLHRLIREAVEPMAGGYVSIDKLIPAQRGRKAA